MRCLQPLLYQEGAAVTILAYHLVGAGTRSPVDLPEALFHRHMQELSQGAHVCSLEQAVENLARGALPDGRTVVLTFDDAYENFYTRVFPVLQEYGLPATLYVPVYFVEGKAPPPIGGTEGLPPCSWSQLREMQASGLVSVGAHTCTHPSLTAVSPRRARWEVEASKAVLEERLGTVVRSFCYPRALWNRALEEVVRNAYATAVVGGGVKPRPRAFNPHRLQRISIRHDAPATLAPLLRSRVWLEEWVADQYRRLRT